VLATTAGAYQAVPDPVNPDPRGKRPIDAVESVFLEDLTWMEVRDAMAAGKKTVLVATGGVEQNGPYLATGKHNVILRGTTEAIARKLGNALVAPIVAFVPEGDFDPPSLHMKYPGTISLTEDTYRALLRDICRSFQVTGFETIVLIGDSGGNQDGMKAVAEELSAQWGRKGPRVLYIPEYWDYPGLEKWLADNGIVQTSEGLHDDFAITSQMLAVDPQTVRAAERQKAGVFKINGVDLAPVAKTAEWGRRIIQRRATQTVDAIHKALAK
jgi:creatinine amidohydrolase/Fe(II)-dependent formamide hydrolase-like protein